MKRSGGFLLTILSTTARIRATAALGVAATAALALGLTGCSGDAPAEKAATKADTAQTEAPSTPGSASCDFTGGGPEKATIAETADAYEVTITGDFIDPAKLQPKSGRTTFSVSLWDPEKGDPTSLVSQYDRGELAQSGTQEEAELTPLKTEVKLEQGKFTAKYPKPIPALEKTPPTTWTPSLYVDAGTGEQPTTYRCGDGRALPFVPLGG